MQYSSFYQEVFPSTWKELKTNLKKLNLEKRGEREKKHFTIVEKGFPNTHQTMPYQEKGKPHIKSTISNKFQTTSNFEKTTVSKVTQNQINRTDFKHKYPKK